MGYSSQLEHIVDQTTNDRECSKEHQRDEQHGFPAEDIAELGIDDKKA